MIFEALEDSLEGGSVRPAAPPSPAARVVQIVGSRHPSNEYLLKHQLHPPRVASDPRSDLGIVVVIPCHDEPDLRTTLGALWACDRPPCAVEVLVVINAGEDAAAAVVERNRRTEAEARAWIRSRRCTSASSSG